MERDLCERFGSSSFSSPRVCRCRGTVVDFGSFVDEEWTSIKLRIQFPNLVSFSCMLCCGETLNQVS